MSFGRIAYALLAPAFLAAPLIGGEAVPADNALEDKVKALEKRISELEATIEKMRDTQPRGRMNRPGARDPRDWDDMFERMRRQMEEFGQGFGPDRFNDRFGPGFGTQKPRLGVDMAPVSDELVERFNNKVEDGAFVMSVVPNSPAEKAGILVGDCIIAFGGKAVNSPQELRDAVMTAPKGKNEATLVRKGAEMKVNVDLGPADISTEDLGLNDEHAVGNGGWIRRKDLERTPGAKTIQKSRVDVKASALTVTDELAQTLKLTDEQRKKMLEVLADKQARLNQEVAKNSDSRGNRFNFSFSGDLNRLVEKYAAEAEKELAASLTAEQMKKWSDYRKEHNSVSMSHTHESTTTNVEDSSARPNGATGF